LNNKSSSQPGRSSSFSDYLCEAAEEVLADPVYNRSYKPCSPIEANIRPTQPDVLSLPDPQPPIYNSALKQRRVFGLVDKAAKLSFPPQQTAAA
jgi:hypothetical protein